MTSLRNTLAVPVAGYGVIAVDGLDKAFVEDTGVIAPPPFPVEARGLGLAPSRAVLPSRNKIKRLGVYRVGEGSPRHWASRIGAWAIMSLVNIG